MRRRDFYEIHGRSDRDRSEPSTLCRVAKLISRVPQISERLNPARYTRLVRPLVGAGWHGHAFPAATMPFGLVQLSPDRHGPLQAWYDWDHSGGYHCCDRVITGFSHTHIEGTGAPELGDALLMPEVKRRNWAWERCTQLIWLPAGASGTHSNHVLRHAPLFISAADRPPLGLIPDVTMPSSRDPGKLS